MPTARRPPPGVADRSRGGRLHHRRMHQTQRRLGQAGGRWPALAAAVLAHRRSDPDRAGVGGAQRGRVPKQRTAPCVACGTGRSALGELRPQQAGRPAGLRHRHPALPPRAAGWGGRWPEADRHRLAGRRGGDPRQGPARGAPPLPADVGDAVVAYLRLGRPPVRNPWLFLAARAPHRHLTRDAVTGAVRNSCLRAGLARVGPHRLRHTAATQMLQAGASLREVSQVLRQRGLATTSIYAKVDRSSLRTLALPWPGGQP